MGEIDPVWSGVGKGWQPIIESLHNALLLIDPDYKVIQVKEKFGILRFYLSTKDYLLDEMRSLVSLAEAISSRTCEFCGRPGTQHTPRYWTKTCCDECLAKWGKEQNEG